MNESLRAFLKPTENKNFRHQNDSDCISSYSGQYNRPIKPLGHTMTASKYDNKVRTHFSGNMRSEVPYQQPNKRVMYKSRNGREDLAYQHETDQRIRSQSHNGSVSNWSTSGKKKSSKQQFYQMKQRDLKNQLQNKYYNSKGLKRQGSSKSIISQNSQQSQRPHTANKYERNHTQQDLFDSQSAYGDDNSSCQQTITETNYDEDKCFSVDYSFLDTMSVSDPRLQGAYAEELLNNPNLDIDMLMDQDPDYFHHIFGNCACAKCICTKCRCRHSKARLTYKNGFSSSYNKQFGPKSTASSESQNSVPPLFQTHYDSLSHKQRMSKNIDPTFRTTNQTFYVPHSHKREVVKQQHKLPTEKPMFSQTSYGNQFPHWQEYDPTWIFKAPQTIHTTGYKNNQIFNKKTAYKKQYPKSEFKVPYYNEARVKVENASSKPYSKIYSGVKNRTQYSDIHYDQHDLNDQINTKEAQFHSSTKKANLVPSFKDQYKTVHTRDFVEKEPFDRNLLKSQLKKSFNTISSKKSKKENEEWKTTLKDKLFTWRNQRSKTVNTKSR